MHNNLNNYIICCAIHDSDSTIFEDIYCIVHKEYHVVKLIGNKLVPLTFAMAKSIKFAAFYPDQEII